MTVATILIFAALAASLVLLFQARSRLWPAVATAASGLQAAFALGVVKFSVQGVPLALILAAALTAAGVMIWIGSSGKTQVTGATVIALVGAVQVLNATL
jgi:hypothetical protein